MIEKSMMNPHPAYFTTRLTRDDYADSLKLRTQKYIHLHNVRIPEYGTYATTVSRSDRYPIIIYWILKSIMRLEGSITLPKEHTCGDYYWDTITVYYHCIPSLYTITVYHHCILSLYTITVYYHCIPSLYTIAISMILYIISYMIFDRAHVEI
eukprot:1058887_1